MRQKSVRICRNPEHGQSITVTWGDGGENEYPGVTGAATALGCSSEWLEETLQSAFRASIGISLLDLHWDDGTWWLDNTARKFSTGDLVSLLGEVSAVHDDKGEVSVRIFGVASPVTLSAGNVELIERRADNKGPLPDRS
jgi:hypothetical protein